MNRSIMVKLEISDIPRAVVSLGEELAAGDWSRLRADACHATPLAVTTGVKLHSITLPHHR
jgi:hypothetical protein